MIKLKDILSEKVTGQYKVSPKVEMQKVLHMLS